MLFTVVLFQISSLGNGTFQYAPGSNRFGYISYEGDAAKSEFADGFLHIINSSDFTELYKYENVTAFDITDSGAAFVSFFTNDKNEADEAAVIWWNGTRQTFVFDADDMDYILDLVYTRMIEKGTFTQKEALMELIRFHRENNTDIKTRPNK